MRILVLLLLAIAFLAVSVVALYLTYQVFAVYFTSALVGKIAAVLLFLFGGTMVFRGLIRA